MATLRDSAFDVQTDLPVDPVSEADRAWLASQSEDFHDLVGPPSAHDDYDCSLDHEDEHAEAVEQWFRRNGPPPTSGDELPDEWYIWGGHPG